MLPSLGCHAVSSAKLNAVNRAIAAAMSIETIKAEPAKPAAMPVTMNIPAPMIAPTLMAVASNKPKEGFNLRCWASSSFMCAPDIEICF